MSASLAIAMWAVMGGLWRRMDGGWLGLPKSICIAIGTILALIPASYASFTLCGYWPEAVAWGVIISAIVMVFFVVSLHPGPSFTNAEVFKKYGPFGVFYWCARLWWPDSWTWGGFIDGKFSIGEIGLGASVYATLAALCLWIAGGM